MVVAAEVVLDFLKTVVVSYHRRCKCRVESKGLLVQVITGVILFRIFHVFFLVFTRFQTAHAWIDVGSR